MTNQAMVAFGGAAGIMNASMTLLRGVTPSTCMLQLAIGGTLPRSDSDLVWTWGATAIRFRNCRLDKIEPAFGSDGTQTLMATVLDRRWRWQRFGSIHGVYNVHKGSRIAYEKKPSELLKLCFDALGEQSFNMQGITAKTDQLRPEIDWDYIPPAEALADLCEQLGVVICLGLDDRFYLYSNGVGRDVDYPGKLEVQSGYDPQDWPSKIRIVGSIMRFQQDFELEAVGKDVDGKTKPIDELLYKPVNGWSDVEHFMDVTAGLARKYAQQSVFRWYRIKVPVTIKGAPAELAQVDKLDAILPLMADQVEKMKEDDSERNRPPWVFGEFYEREERTEQDPSGVDNTLPNQPKNLYLKGFTVNGEFGRVEFSEPVMLLERGNGQGGVALFTPVEAKIKLRIAVGVRNKYTNQFYRDFYETPNPANQGPSRRPPSWTVRTAVFDDVANWSYYVGGKQTNNRKEFETSAKYYYDQVLAGYEAKQSYSATIGYFVPCATDGAIAQVTWSIQDGIGTTRISRNREEAIIAPSDKERRFLEKIGAVVVQAKQGANQQAQKLKRAKP